MLALYRSGRQAEALDAYQAGRTLLIEELGLEPGEDLHLLETAILSGDPLLHVDSEQLGTPVAVVTPAPAEPYRAEKPHQLPAGTADFVGGEALVESVKTALVGMDAHRATGVVVIVGKPGIGKSTAATHIAAKEVLGHFLRALGIPGPVIPDATDERAEMYRTILATRRMLVVLDDVATEGQIGPLLPGGGSCAVIVTSRARLTGLPGCHRIELDVLTVQQALELLGRVSCSGGSWNKPSGP
jgi:Bacterial transcriptional activator domain/NB-ARC domain